MSKPILKRVLLVMPTLYDDVGDVRNSNLKFSSTNRRVVKQCPPLGIGYIASSLNQIGCEVKIFDIMGRNEQLASVINSFLPHMICISCMTTAYPEFVQVVRLIREKINYDGILIAGGPHITIEPRKTLEQTSINACVVGEGERIMQEVALKGLLPEIRGLYLSSGFTGNSELINNLDELPFPSYEFYEMDKYVLHKNMFPIMPMRGCPYNCVFCSSKFLVGPKSRFRSPENVVEEVSYLKEKYGYSKFIMYADTFVLNKGWIKKFADLVSKLEISFRCNGRINLMDEDLLKDLKRAGCFQIDYGIETVVQKIADNIRKSQKVKDIHNVIRKTIKYGIHVHLYCMLSLPGEKVEDMRQTIKFAKQMAKIYGCSYTFQILRVFPGTPLAAKIKFNHPDWTQIVHPELPYPNAPIYREMDTTVIYNLWLESMQRPRRTIFERFNPTRALKFIIKNRQLSLKEFFSLFVKN